MKRNQNFPILLVVIAVVAVLALLARPQAGGAEMAALQNDMVLSLSRLWGPVEQKVELIPNGQRFNARVAVSMPAGLRQRQQRWNYPFLRFVAARHPKCELAGLEIKDLKSNLPVPEYAMNGMLAERAYRSIGPGEEEERFCEMTARQFSLSLERQLGDSNRALVLVDAQQPHSAREQVYGRRAAGAVPNQPYFRSMMLTEVCVVVDHEVAAVEWERFKRENASVNGARFRVVTLP
ncbi:hypothetical protein JST97_18530 [bacterium]|nr:hypothetical protein [bacterium]